MIDFRIKLADVPMQIHAMHASTMDFCQKYLTEETPFFETTIAQSDIEEERRISLHTYYSDEYLETLALCRRIMEKMTEYHALLFHGCVIAVNEKAYMFTAKSGTGKTTHARLWLKNIDGCHILNGDKPLLLFQNNGIFICGTPWQGKENYGANEKLPLEAICILERDTRNHIERIEFKTALETLLAQAHHPNGESILNFVQRIGQLSNIKLYHLGCNMEDEAAWTAFRGMVKDGNE